MMFRQKENLFLNPVTNTNSAQASSLSSNFNFTEYDMEQNCLLKLKEQRQKVQEYMDLVQSQQQQLHQKESTIAELKVKVEQYSLEDSYKEAYEELKIQYEQLFSKSDQEKYQHQQTIANLEQQLLVATNKYEQKCQEHKILKEDVNMLHNHWKNIVEEKDQANQFLERQLNKRKQMFFQETQKMKLKIKELRDLYQQKTNEHKSIQKSTRRSSKAKEQELQKVKKQLAQSQNECSRFRIKSSAKQNEYEVERQQLQETIEQLNIVVTSLRKQLTQRIMEIQPVKQTVRKQERKIEQMQECIYVLKTSQKCSKNKQSVNVESMKREKEYRKQLEQQIQRLKRQNIKHVQDFNMLQIQLHKWRNLSQKRQESLTLKKMMIQSHYH